MTIRRASVILPGHGLEDFPTHLADQAAAELLAAVTALWHPSLIHATQALPGWHSADEPPDPATLGRRAGAHAAGEPPANGSDWCDRLRATAPRNPPPVEAVASRQETRSPRCSVRRQSIPTRSRWSSVADFLALGYRPFAGRAAHSRDALHAPCSTRINLTSAVVAAAGRRGGRQSDGAARKSLVAHSTCWPMRGTTSIRSTSIVIDITLLADSTLGEPLRAKLASACADEPVHHRRANRTDGADHPETLAELQRALGGRHQLHRGRHVSRRLSRQPIARVAFGRTHRRPTGGPPASRSRIRNLRPVRFGILAAVAHVLKNLGFRGALHAAFDGGSIPRADQRKTNWGAGEGSMIEALSATPLDVSRPETWLKLAERIGDSIAHDHVATIVLAGWPGTGCEYFDDLRRAARFGTVLGKLVTLDEYFRDTREAGRLDEILSARISQTGRELKLA